MVRGLGLKRGALASSIAHDSHNIIVAGVVDEDLRAAAEAVAAMERRTSRLNRRMFFSRHR